MSLPHFHACQCLAVAPGLEYSTQRNTMQICVSVKARTLQCRHGKNQYTNINCRRLYKPLPFSAPWFHFCSVQDPCPSQSRTSAQYTHVMLRGICRSQSKCRVTTSLHVLRTNKTCQQSSKDSKKPSTWKSASFCCRVSLKARLS